MNLTAGTILSERYEVIEKIGVGGMAVVYRGRDEKLERDVTIKVLKEEFSSNEEFKAKFKIEARAAARLSHPNIVNVYDVGQDGDIYYIVMEYIHGISLKEAISEKAPFDSLTTLGIGVQIASALVHAHKNHIVHRDIKPQNILLAVDGTTKVTDFGIARAATEATLATSQDAIGSVHYLSPEQARGGYVDEKSDIYSLGITMFEMITGQIPFDGDSSVSIALKHINNELPQIHQYNPEASSIVEGIIKKATRKKADERYANIGLMLEDLKKAMVDVAAEHKKQPVPSSSTHLEKNDRDSLREEKESVKLETFENNKKQNRHGTARPNTSDISQKEDVSKAGKYDFPEGGVSFDRYKKKFKVSKSDDYEEDDKAHDYGENSGMTDKKVVIAAVITAIVIIIIISTIGIKLLNGQGILGDSTVTVPTFIGEEFESAAQIAEDIGITLEKTGEEYSDDYSEGMIIDQSVEEGTSMDKNGIVGVTVSLGLNSYSMPDVLYNEESVAENALESLVGSVDKSYEYSDDIPAGVVMQQSPEAGEMINKESVVMLTISRGTEKVTVTVPNVEGKILEDAQKDLEAWGLSVGTITRVESNTAQKDVVITQTVKAGEEVTSGSQVGLVLSKGAQTAPSEEGNSQSGTQTQQPQTPSEQPQQNTQPPVQEEPTVPETRTLSFNVNAPGDMSGDIAVKVLKVSGSDVQIVYDDVKNSSEFPFSISVTGSGSAEIQLYLNNNYQWSENVNF